MTNPAVDRTDQTVSPSPQSWVEEVFPTSDAILILDFGLDATRTRSGAQLRSALAGAGYRSHAVRHLLRVSPLLERLPADRFRLNPS